MEENTPEQIIVAALEKRGTVMKAKDDQIASLQQYIEYQKEDIANLQKSLTMIIDKEAGDYWTWQGDGEDHLNSLCCPVLINANDLKDIVDIAKIAFQIEHGHTSVYADAMSVAIDNLSFDRAMKGI